MPAPARGENQPNDWARGEELANGREVKYTFSAFTYIVIDYTDGSHIKIDRPLRQKEETITEWTD